MAQKSYFPSRRKIVPRLRRTYKLEKRYFPSTVRNGRPLDSATVESDIRQYIRQHPNKHVTF